MENNKEIIIESLERIKERIAANIDSKGRKASGRTAASMRIEKTENGAMLIGRQYFQSLEIGRPAGNVPRGFNAIIRQWMIDKGVSFRIVPYKTQRLHKYSEQERSLNIAASAIAHSIMTTGTSLYKKGGEANIYTPVISEELELLKEKLAVNMRQYIENEYSRITGLIK